MKKTALLLTICCALIACKKNSVDFSFSPTEPRAGETVTFSNLSTSGEEWEWTFGDGNTSTLKFPSHVYKNPGTYTVILKVDNKNNWTATKEITVKDTIPTFVASDSVFYIYQDYTFTANAYNPYNYTQTYEWVIDGQTVGTSGTLTTYFTKPNEAEQISLRLTINDQATLITKPFCIQNRAAKSVLFRTTEGDYRQRIFEQRAEEVKQDASAALLLEAEQDTLQTYNGAEFRLSELNVTFPELQGFKIANRKIYFRADGLWVAHIDGSDAVQIDAAPCTAMTLDTQDNRIYWANAEGVWYMPFIGSDNNKFVTTPTLLNELKNITKIAVDYELK